MSHTLCLALIDRLSGIDQGCYEMYAEPFVNQADIGPTPLIPDPTLEAWRHPLVHVNCDRRYRYREDMFAIFQKVVYPHMTQLRELRGLPTFCCGYVEGAAWGILYPIQAH